MTTEAGPKAPLGGILVRTVLTAVAWIGVVLGRAYYKGTDLTPRKLAIVLSCGAAAALVATTWQWFRTKPWSWAHTILAVMVLFLVFLGLTIAGLSLQV